MHHFKSLRRLALGAAITGAAIGAVPAIASASSICDYEPTLNQMRIIDGSGIQPLRIARTGDMIRLSDGPGTESIFCHPPGGGPADGTATVLNIDRIEIRGPITNSTDGYILDESGGRIGPGATLEPGGTSEIEVLAFPTGGGLGTLEVRGDIVQDNYRVGANGFVDLGGEGDVDFSISGGASEVRLLGGSGADFLSGQAIGPLGKATVRLVLDGGPGADNLKGGDAGDTFLGGDGQDTLSAVDNKLDIIAGGPDFDRANVDRIFDVFISGVEQVIQLPAIGQLKLAPRVLKSEADRTARLTMKWKTPKSWRDLRKVEISLHRDGKVVGTIDARPAAARLTAHGVVDLKATACKLSRHGKWVTAKLAFRLPKSLAGQSVRVDVTATDKQGNTQLERGAGTIRVG